MAAPDRRLVAALVAIAVGVGLIVVALRPEPSTAPGVRSAEELGPLRQHARVVARDPGQSTRYGDRSVWVFADTELVGPDAFLSNTAASTADLTGSDGITLTAADVAGTAGELHDEFLPSQGLVETGDQPQQGTLAATGIAEHGENFAGIERQRQALAC